MNFEIHKRAIVGTVAAILALALMAGGAYAEPGKGKGKGPRHSVDVFNLCTIVDNQLMIDSDIIESSGDDPLFLVTEPTGAAVTVTGFERGRQVVDTIMVNPYVLESPINLCPTLDGSKKIKVMIALEFNVAGETRSYTSSCDDDPDNNVYDLETGDLIYDEALDESSLDKYMPIDCS